MKYPRQWEGEWVNPVKSGYKLMCCDCGLTHVVNFKTERSPNGRGISVSYQMWRDNRATAAARRKRPPVMNEGGKIITTPGRAPAGHNPRP